MKLLTLALAATQFVAAQSLSGLRDATVKVKDVEVPSASKSPRTVPKPPGTLLQRRRNSFPRPDCQTTAHCSSTGITPRPGRSNRARRRDRRKLLPSRSRRENRLSISRQALLSVDSAKREDVPSIGHSWVIPTTSDKGESAWQFIVRQSGPEVTAPSSASTAIPAYRVRHLSETEKFILTFSGARPAVFEVKPQPDGSIDILQNGTTQLTANCTAAKAKKACRSPLTLRSTPAQRTRPSPSPSAIPTIFPAKPSPTKTRASAAKWF